MSKLKLIIQREFIAKVRNKSFLVMTFLSPILLVGMGALVFFLMKKNDEKVKEIVYVDNSGLFSKDDFKSLVEQKIKNLQHKLDQNPSHPLTNAAESYITSLQNINYDLITWPLSKFVGEYCSENSITVVHEMELI